jgi:hypothetical protein
VLPGGGGDWNLRAELRQCRKQRAQVSSVIVAILCPIRSRSASAAKCCPASSLMYAVFNLYKSFPERAMELADTNCRCIQFGICCLLYEERTCLCMLLTAAREWRDSDTATSYGPQFIHLLVSSPLPEVTLHIFHPLKTTRHCGKYMHLLLYHRKIAFYPHSTQHIAHSTHNSHSQKK